MTNTFPTSEKFGMVSDIRRSANSILHNIAERYGRFEIKDKTRFYKISRASAYELISQSIASCSLLYLTNDEKEYLKSSSVDIIDELDLIIKAVESR